MGATGHAARLLAGRLWIGLLLLIATAPSGQAAVAYRASTCANANVSSSITLSTPATTQVGDVIVASVVSYDGHSTPSAPSPSTGWTTITTWTSGLSAGSMLWRLATSAGTTSYTFSLNAAIATTAVVSAYSGADPSAPVATALPLTPTSGSGTSVPLPNASVARTGSLRVSTIQRIGDVNATYPGPLAETCASLNSTVTGSSNSSASEAVSPGTTPSRTATLSASATWRAMTIVLQPVVSCGAGGQSMTGFASLSFPSRTLSAYDQTTSAVAHVVIDDQDPAHPGWKLTGTSTPFTNGSSTLPLNATQITGATLVGQAGACAAPSNLVSYPVTMPAGSTPPAAATLVDSAAGTGTGPIDVDMAVTLALPASATAGTYTSTWTLTLAAGP